MKFFLVILLIAISLQAQYIRSIRIASLSNEKFAKQYLKKVKKFTKKHPEISKLQKGKLFRFIYRKSGKYFVVVAEPFTDKKTLVKVNDILKKKFKGIYITRLSSLPKNITTKEKQKKIKINQDLAKKIKEKELKKNEQKNAQKLQAKKPIHRQ